MPVRRTYCSVGDQRHASAISRISDRRSLGMLGAILAAMMIATMPMPLRADATVAKATISDFATSIQLPSANMYLYGMVTGGASQSSAFATGQYAQAVDAAGYLAAALAYGSTSQNSYATSAAYQVVGGVSVAGSWDSFTAFSGSNTSSGAASASVNFTVTENSVVVVFGLASSQQSISLGGISGLQVDAVESGPSANLGMEIAHASLSPGTYTVTEQSAALAAGQDPTHMVDLIGVFVFGSKSSTVSIAGVTNAASYAKDANGNGSAVAPGSLVSIFGTYPGATAATATTVPLPTSLGGVSVTFNGIPAPISAVVPTGTYPLINAQVPFEVLSAGQTAATANVVVTVNSLSSAPQAVPIVPAAPGIFTIPPTGQGNAILVFVDPADNTTKIAAPASASGSIGYPTAPIPPARRVSFTPPESVR